ncbi:excinuclease ABC subunit A [Parcubacteria bacterium DG_72]|nr:MAG: excinuclease ABC subunit A [Parcubacteria bacterium DG_72]
MINKDVIKIRGAKVHNLKNISLDIPRNKLNVITGLSGSGKSSLAFDTLYAEGQRRYVESLSAYARQFLGVMQKPNVERIEGISPAISIDQRKAAHNPRSTVGTITEIYDYLRLLFARIGKPHCPNCGKSISRQTIEQITDQVLKLEKNSEINILGPVVRSKKGEQRGVLEEIQRSGFVRVRIDKTVLPIEEALSRDLDRNKKHNIEVVVDRLLINEDLDKSRLVDSLEIAVRMGKGLVIINPKSQIPNPKDNDLMFSEHFACEECGISLPELEPRLFSFNSPHGACPECTGLGEKLEVDPQLVVPNKNLTLAEGAIIPWMRASHKVGRQGYYWYKLSDLAEQYSFSMHDPVKDIAKKYMDMILYGDGRSFEGVIPNLERRYHETDSDWTRQEIEQYMVVRLCPKCQGKRLKPEVLAVTIGGKSIHDIVSMSIDKTKEFFEKRFPKNHAYRQAGKTSKISQPIIKEIINRLNFLKDVGLDYLTLDRKASTLSGGEGQRIRLATQIGSKLTGVLYILDEPSIGLHPRDQKRLIDTLKKMRDLGNTVIVVEHDEQTIKSADWVIDVGPGAGKHGGRIIFEGTPKQLLKASTLTGKYLAGKLKIHPVIQPGARSADQAKFLTIKGAKEHNLKNIDAKIPLANFVCITGVSGSGKSSLMNDILAKALLKKFYRAKAEPGEYKKILGVENLNKVVLIDQSPIGRTPRSNPATYTGAFTYIRDLFAKTREARIRGYTPGRFSFNIKGGRCEVCEGQGEIKIEMYFLPDVYVECKECNGKRYSKEALEIDYKGKNIAEVLEMTVEEATEFFKNIPSLYSKLKTLNQVGLSYIELGQPATSLSGGEAQRVKLATELSRKETGKTLYILDEPTTGLHMDDVKKLVKVLRELVNKGNTVLVIEHHPSLISNADWIIDLGPEGGDKGGYIVAEGTPKDIKRNKKSYTSKYLTPY